MKILISTIMLIGFLATGCATTSPSETVFVDKYKHRIVRVVPVTKHKTSTIRVHHVGTLTKKEKNNLRHWYKNKYRKPRHRVDVIFIQN